jgi:CO dehydrogenase maturation factor
MPKTIAVAGKGGTGKTTVSALLVRALIARGVRPILAVDADPNSNLGDALGLETGTSIGRLQAETLTKIRELPAGVPLGRYLEYELHQAIAEGEGVDLLTMGHGEGPGCYCAVNHILRRYLETLRSSYPCTVVDNEAGLEHLSRRVSSGIDVLLVVSDPSPIALRAATRIAALADDLQLAIARRFLLLNRVDGDLSSDAVAEVARTRLEMIGAIPFDGAVADAALVGRSIDAVPTASPSRRRIEEALDRLWTKEEST